ncbi:MAG: GrlR family regulatory protein [Xanthobacteraceae bacterium]
MLKGLYKVELETPRRKAVGVVFASNGELHGGSSAFAYVGSYKQVGHKISGVVTARQHTHNPDLPPLFELSEVRIDFRGVEKNDFASVEGTAAEAPSVGFKALLTRLCD